MLNLLASGLYLQAFMFIIAAVLSIMLHEVAHGYIALKNGDYTAKYAGRLNLNPVSHFDLIGFGLFIFIGFGWAKPVPINPLNFKNYRKGLLQVSVAGVIVNFILAFIAYPLFILSFNITNEKIFDLVRFFFLYLFSINLSLFVFNLLPIYPLDGFRIIESRVKYGNSYVDFMYRYGFYVFAGFLIFINYIAPNFFPVLVSIIGFPIRYFWGLFGL